MTNFEKVKTFMQTFGQEVKSKPSFSTEKINQLRYNLIKEELEEFKQAIANYDKAIQINKNFLIAKHNRGLALLLDKNETEALNNFKG